MNDVSWAALAWAVLCMALAVLAAVRRDRAHRRRIKGYEAARKRLRYSATELADLSRDDIDPGWEAVKAMLPDCAGEYPKTPQQGENQ